MGGLRYDKKLSGSPIGAKIHAVEFYAERGTVSRSPLSLNRKDYGILHTAGAR